jgi:ATP-dependent exoDNAse (exonuclease V) alpha subunit
VIFSMLGTRAFAELVTRVDAARGKLVVVGDTNQLPSIEAGGVLGALATRLPAIALVDNRRQEQLWECEAVELVRDGEADRALDHSGRSRSVRSPNARSKSGCEIG